MSSWASKLCTVCEKSTTHRCSRCKSAHYCSRAFQRVDWPTHKLLCATFSSFDARSRPTDEHFQAILFPVDDKEPQVVWLHGEWNPFGRYQSPEVGSFIGHDSAPTEILIWYNPVSKRRLSNTINIYCRDTFLIDRSKANNSIAAILATKPGQYHDWRGPIIAVGKVGQATDPRFCKDLDMSDFRDITDYFLWYNPQA